MSRSFRQGWPWLLTMGILYFGGSSLLKKYPRASPKAVSPKSGVLVSDSALVFIQAEHRRDSLARISDSTSLDGGSFLKNPFRPLHGSVPLSAQPSGGAVTDPPWRQYVLKGTVGNEVATIADRHGKKLIVKVGDRVDSATVLSIEPNKVMLKDRAGKFELSQTE